MRHVNKTPVPVKAWAKKSPVEQATALFQTALELGVLSEMGAGMSFYDDPAQLARRGCRALAGRIVSHRRPKRTSMTSSS